MEVAGAIQTKLSWADVARANGRVVHPQMQWLNISRGRRAFPSGAEILQPQTGDLPALELERLAGLLAPHTSTPHRVWLAIWEGWGHFLQRLRVAAVSIPERSYYLFRGDITDSGQPFAKPFGQSANMWWPDDRAWFVSTEIDFMWTYVAGSRQCIDDVLADPVLEVLPSRANHRLAFDSDQINID